MAAAEVLLGFEDVVDQVGDPGAESEGRHGKQQREAGDAGGERHGAAAEEAPPATRCPGAVPARAADDICPVRVRLGRRARQRGKVLRQHAVGLGCHRRALSVSSSHARASRA
jgi:hypothetical protein